MRTPKLRGVAVVAGFAGVSMLVAGTASAMVAGTVNSTVGTAVQLHQADPASQTPPVPAQATTQAPIEVGPGAIKCDADGTCASRITVKTDTPGPQSDPATKPTPAASSDNGEQSDRSSSDPSAPSSQGPDPQPNDRHAAAKNSQGTQGRNGKHQDSAPHTHDHPRGRENLDFDSWQPNDWAVAWDKDWGNGFPDHWPNRVRQDWDPRDWFTDDWYAQEWDKGTPQRNQ